MNERRKGPGPPQLEFAVTGKESTGGGQRGGRRCAATSPGRPNPVGPRCAGQPVNNQRWAAATTCSHVTPANCARPPWRERLDCPLVAGGPGGQLPAGKGVPPSPGPRHARRRVARMPAAGTRRRGALRPPTHRPPRPPEAPDLHTVSEPVCAEAPALTC